MIRAATDNALQLKERTTLCRALAALCILAKPKIVAAVTLSGFTGMVLAGAGLPEARTGAFCVASLFLMAAGSALTNSVLERRTDQRMERLAARSAALRRVGTRPALVTAVALTSAALLLASAGLATRAALLLLTASLCYALCYTLLLKRRTHWAAVLGGLPGALPVLIGNAAVSSRPEGACLALFLVMLIWQPPHFWLLSLSHLEEYRAAGVPVLPLLKGERFTKTSICLCALALIPASLLLWSAGPCSVSYAACAVLLGGSFLLACRYYLNHGVNYRAAFRCSIVYLVALFTVIIADLTVWPAP